MTRNFLLIQLLLLLDKAGSCMWRSYLNDIALTEATMANKITFEILSGWNCRYEHYKPNRAGVRFGVMGASSFLPGVQIFIALFGNNEKTGLFQDVDLNRKVVRVTVMCHAAEVVSFALRLNEKNRQSFGPREKDSLSLWGPAGRGSDVADRAIYHL